MITRNVSLAVALALLASPAIGLAQEGNEPAPVREDPRKSTQQRAPSDIGFFAWLMGAEPEKKEESAKAEGSEGHGATSH